MRMPHFNRLSRTARMLLLLAGLLVAALIICEILGWPFLRAPAEHFMSQQLDRTVRLTAPFRLHLLGGIRISADGLWISSPQQFNAPHLVDAKKVALGLRYSDVLNRDAIEP